MEYLIRLFERTLINSLEAAALIVAIALLLRIFRRRLSPAWHYALWMLLLAKLLLPWLPGQLESELRWFSLPEAIGSQIPGGYSEGIGQPAAEEIPTRAAGSTGNMALGNVAPVVETSDAGREWPSSLSGALAIVWLIGTATAWLLLAGAHLRTYLTLRRESATEVPRELDKLFKRLIHEGDIRSRVRIRLTGLVSAPALFGIVSPAVLIPRHLIGQLSPNEWECIIRHELAHLKRRDIPINLLAYVLASVHWFNPAVWYGLRGMRADQEAACDASVLSSSELRETYAASIIRLLEIGASRTTVTAGVGFFGTKNQIKRRIVMIHQYKPSKKRVSFIGVAILVAAALFTLPSAFASGKGDSSTAAEQPTTAPIVDTRKEAGSVTIPFIAPTAGKLTSPYGERIHPVTSKKSLHDGIDIANKKGTDVYAAAGGKVVKAEYDKKYGNTIKIEHNGIWTTEYRHLDKLSVEEGASVESGDLIGLMGSTGESTGPHLHFSVLSDGKYIDPMTVIKQWQP
ncbi:M56 family metallopeptidase [Cohnella cholangitidis]|uniref:Peptidoglycan DD-metalloendopeptidase family protein n=1 Tax=Cohnella cholangitidis TaxID=2598458 RepID=A0A7G5C1J3_9BACL|nr:M23/M56 family metallopeptidase [Cohnella cholangitidis]QMV43077.1 peptidoglycan DD-metalloendopeptidase family protein [Cohnella cholangitidis]